MGCQGCTVVFIQQSVSKREKTNTKSRPFHKIRQENLTKIEPFNIFMTLRLHYLILPYNIFCNAVCSSEYMISFAQSVNIFSLWLSVFLQHVRGLSKWPVINQTWPCVVVFGIYCKGDLWVTLTWISQWNRHFCTSNKIFFFFPSILIYCSIVSRMRYLQPLN